LRCEGVHLDPSLIANLPAYFPERGPTRSPVGPLVAFEDDPLVEEPGKGETAPAPATSRTPEGRAMTAELYAIEPSGSRRSARDSL
jgi:hypothetical protein